ncbi:DUF2071 domain-containing protein [Flavihumibacter sp. R14]|nr:DUF2071 domain-containing protein [Flavihumibacter soli]
MKSNFLAAEWRKLTIANYSVDPDILRSYLPYKTELDLWNNKCYVSLVGFKFTNTRLKGFKIPFHSDFEEVNLRFYVRYKDSTGWKRGVTFIKEFVPKPALTFVANSIYREKYVTLPMKHAWDLNEERLSVSYHWQQDGAWNDFKINAHPLQNEMISGSEEEFITEHYWGYTRINPYYTSEYGVEHPRWTTYTVQQHQILVDFERLYGAAFAHLAHQTPDSVMLAEGSEIIVRSANKIT